MNEERAKKIAAMNQDISLGMKLILMPFFLLLALGMVGIGLFIIYATLL